MSIYIPNHSKLINQFILREEALICWSFAAVASNVVSSNLKPLFPKVCKTAPMEMKNSKGSNCWLPERCFVNSCYQMPSKASKANGKTLQLEKETLLNQLSWKLIMNRAQCLSQRYQLHQFSQIHLISCDSNRQSPLCRRWYVVTSGLCAGACVHCWVASVDVNEAEQAVSQTKFGPSEGHQS